MFYALNKDGDRIEAYDANKDEKYTCPICGNRVILKRGSINIDHFAHELNECEDNWNYDMSEWHKRMQNYFPKESHEVVVRHKNRVHRADVLIGNIVLEFQNSPITAAEFEDRNEFFKNAGFRLAWVFNLSQIPEESLYASDEKENMMIWKHPMRIFANADYLGENNKRFALWFSFAGDCEMEDDDDDNYWYMYRVIWAVKDDNGRYSMRRFFIFDRPISLHVSEKINPDYFFYSKEDYHKEELSVFKNRLSELKRTHAFSIKYRGKKGEPKHAYICPRRNEKFGIDMWGENGCFYCKYCYMVAQKESEDGTMYASYCCYPNQVRELFEAHPGYECPQVCIFEL